MDRGNRSQCWPPIITININMRNNVCQAVKRLWQLIIVLHAWRLVLILGAFTWVNVRVTSTKFGDCCVVNIPLNWNFNWLEINVLRRVSKKRLVKLQYSAIFVYIMSCQNAAQHDSRNKIQRKQQYINQSWDCQSIQVLVLHALNKVAVIYRVAQKVSCTFVITTLEKHTRFL